MKISFFLIPKDEVVYISSTATLRQAMEKMEYHRYTAVPLLNKKGEYAGTLTEGDLLWALNSRIGFAYKSMETIRLDEIPKKTKNTAVHIDAEIESLLLLTMNQNFVPVIDDRNIFIGIVRRREIIGYFAEKYGAKL